MGIFSPFKSAPAQNALPSPVIIPTRKAGSLSSHDQTASSSACPAELMQLRACGRERVTRRICAPGKESLVKEVGGGGCVNCGGLMVGWRDWVFMTLNELGRRAKTLEESL